MSLDAFQQEFLGSTEPWSDEPKIRHQRLWNNTVHLDLLVNTYSNDHAVSLRFITTYYPDRGKGHASECLCWLTDLADKYGVEILGRVEPVGSLGLSKADLKRWYKRHGFAVYHDSSIRRSPIQREVANG